MGQTHTTSGKDLRLIDELLLFSKPLDMTWHRFFDGPALSVHHAALDRLRSAVSSGELDILTASLADYIHRTEKASSKVTNP